MKFSEFWLEMLKGEHRISSKRVMGCIGWITGLFLVVYCSIKGIEAPEIADVLFYTTAGLLGIDSVASAFKKPSKKEKGTYYMEDEE